MRRDIRSNNCPAAACLSSLRKQIMGILGGVGVIVAENLVLSHAADKAGNTLLTNLGSTTRWSTNSNLKISERMDFAAAVSELDCLGTVPLREKKSNRRATAHLCQNFLSKFQRFLHKYIIMVEAAKTRLVDFALMSYQKK